jgi:hypothetical protein
MSGIFMRTSYASRLAVALLFGCAAASAADLGVVTILDGSATLLRGRVGFELAEGVRVAAGDIVETAPAARYARLEFADGSRVGLGPDTAVELAPPLPAPRSAARLYLLRGWVKLAAASKPAALTGPGFELGDVAQQVVVRVLASGVQVFAEAGTANLRPLGPRPSALVTIKDGQWLTLAGGGKPVLAERPAPAFLQAVPPPFRDSLPARAALFQAKPVAPRRVGEVRYADVQQWLDAEPALRRAELPRWRALAAQPEFRRALIADLGAHPEWRPILFPPPPPPPASAPPSGVANPTVLPQ